MNVAHTRAAVAIALLAAGCGQPQRPSYEQDLAAITVFNARYLGAINAGDAATLAGLTTDGHVMLAPNRPPLVGKRANDEANASVAARFDIDETWTPVETVIDGDLAFQRGTFTVIAIPKGDGDRAEVGGNFMRIYQRQANGEWRMTRDMFNSDRAQTKGLPAGQ